VAETFKTAGMLHMKYVPWQEELYRDKNHAISTDLQIPVKSTTIVPWHENSVRDSFPSDVVTNLW
jgi:hypothetical protein